MNGLPSASIPETPYVPTIFLSGFCAKESQESKNESLDLLPVCFCRSDSLLERSQLLLSL